jgi:hypothetical protein
MASRYTNVYSTSAPANTDKAGLGAQEIRNVKVDVEERLQSPPWAIAYKLNPIGTVTASTVTIDFDSGDYHTLTLPTSGTVTIAITNVPSNSYDEKVASMLTLEITNPASGSADVTWPASVSWPFSTEPSRDTTASKVTIYQMTTVDAGTTWRAALVGTKYD